MKYSIGLDVGGTKCAVCVGQCGPDAVEIKSREEFPTAGKTWQEVLGIYAQRFSIHTMKLVGASWSFIRWPFVRNALLVGLLAAIIALAALCGMVYVLYINEPAIVTVLDWRILAVTAGVVVFFGIAITGLCARVSVTKFLKMKAGELYNI